MLCEKHDFSSPLIIDMIWELRGYGWVFWGYMYPFKNCSVSVGLHAEIVLLCDLHGMLCFVYTIDCCLPDALESS